MAPIDSGLLFQGNGVLEGGIWGQVKGSYLGNGFLEISQDSVIKKQWACPSLFLIWNSAPSWGLWGKLPRFTQKRKIPINLASGIRCAKRR